MFNWTIWQLVPHAKRSSMHRISFMLHIWISLCGSFSITCIKSRKQLTSRLANKRLTTACRVMWNPSMRLMVAFEFWYLWPNSVPIFLMMRHACQREYIKCCPLYSSVHSAQYPKWAIKCWRKESKLCTKSPDRIINWMGHCIRRKSTAEWAKDTNYYYTSTGESLGIATPPREMEWWVGGGLKRRRRSSRRCRIRSTSKEVIQFHFGQLPSYAPKGKIINYGPICAFCRA